LNEVEEGEYDRMEVSLKYLCRRYEGMKLHEFCKLKYPNGEWDHLS